MQALAGKFVWPFSASVSVRLDEWKRQKKKKNSELLL